MFLYALILDSIEANVEQAQNYVEGANVQLSKASVYQVRQRLRIKKNLESLFLISLFRASISLW